MKKRFHSPVLLMLVVSLVISAFPLAQPSVVYAATGYEYKKPQSFSEDALVTG